MARINLEHSRLRNCRIGVGRYHECASFVNADNYQLTVDHPPVLFLSPAGAVDLLMPTSNAARQGLRFTIVNTSGGANTITLKTDGDAAFTPAITIAQNAAVEVICTGSTTQTVGWRATSVT